MEWIHLVNIILVNTGLELNDQVRLYSSLRADVSFFLFFKRTEQYIIDNINLLVGKADRENKPARKTRGGWGETRLENLYAYIITVGVPKTRGRSAKCGLRECGVRGQQNKENK